MKRSRLLTAAKKLSLRQWVLGGVVLLFIIAVPGTWLLGSVIEMDRFGNIRVLLGDESEACSSKGTPFEDIDTFPEAKSMYHARVSALFEERQDLIKGEAGTCDAETQEGFLNPGAITALADELPGWTGDVTFASFASVLLEFERVYECKLHEWITEAYGVVERGEDDPDDSIEDDTTNIYSDFESRVHNFRSKLTEEIAHSRVALDLSLNTIRSYEMAAPITKELKCLQLESLDLRNELNLLTDAMACMPKIWDGITSLHDRAE